MKKKRNTRSTVNAADILLFLICFAGTVASLFTFTRELNISLVGQGSPVAVIYFKHNTAQRCIQNSSIWERLKNSSPIYAGDKIRTAAMSEAYTLFNDGSRIDIHENTLIQVFGKGNKNSVNFVNGSISVQAAAKVNKQTSETKKVYPSFTIQTGGKLLSFDESSSAVLSVNPHDSSEAVLTVTSGEVKVEEIVKSGIISNFLNGSDIQQNVIKSSSEDVMKIAAGASLFIETVPEAVKPSISATMTPVTAKPFMVTSPTSSYSIIQSGNRKASVPFFWNNAKNIHVDFSYTADFAQIIETKYFSSENGRASFKLDFAVPDDIIFWRAVSDDENAKETNVIPSGIIMVHAPVAESFTLAATEVFGEEQAKVMEENITAAEQKSEAAIEELINKEISVPVTQTVEETQIEEAPLETEIVDEVIAEPVEEKVVPVEEKFVPVEEPKPAVKETPKPVVKEEPKPVEKPEPAIVKEKPVLSAPKANAVITEDILMESGDPKINFAWEKVSGAQKYIFCFKNSSGKVLLEKSLKETKFVLDDVDILDEGKFTWSVKAVLTEDGKEYSSRVAEQSFEIKLSEIESASIDTSNLLH